MKLAEWLHRGNYLFDSMAECHTVATVAKWWADTIQQKE